MDELQTLTEFRGTVRGAAPGDPARERTLAAVRALVEAEACAARPRRRPRRRRLLAVGVLVAVVAAVLAVVPAQRSTPSLVDRALAAIGSGSVLHVVGELPTGPTLVDLRTGHTTPVVQQDEIWFDESRGLRRDVSRVDGRVVDDVLQTPAGGFTPHGIVYDCTWIAAHPKEATKARVSCNASDDNGTTPHVVPRPKPTIDPGLAGFVDGYRSVLSSGAARPAGGGTVDGQAVDWLALDTSRGAERVALDAATHKPVLLEPPHGPALRITTIETLDYDPADFRRPSPDETTLPPSRGEARDDERVALDGSAIAAAYPGALWAGQQLNGLPLAAATVQTLVTSWPDGRPPVTGRGLELAYGTLTANGHRDWTKPYVTVSQAPSPQVADAYMWSEQDAPPPPGVLLSEGSPGFAVGFLSIGGGLVAIQASSDDLMLAAARALTPAR